MPGQDPLVAPQADPLIGMVLDNRYRIVDLIGRGGMGAVYRVEHVKMGKIMAAKILHGELSQNQDLVRRFKREAETVSRLNHLNTVSVFDFGNDRGMMYLVMEYIDGRDLAEMIRVDGPLSLMQTARILIQVCSALNEAHAKGIVHRDLKPENILVCRQDERDDFVKVLDFGLAKLRDIQRTKITKQGSLVGTPYYMAPEHIRSEGVDQRSDIYALGAVMYKLLTGETPFKAENPMGIITKHLTEDPTPPSEAYPKLEIPQVADEIVLRAMKKNPDERYASANKMRRALANAIGAADATGSEFQRFSASADSSWHLGEVHLTKTDKWESGKMDAPERLERSEPSAGPEAVKTGKVSSMGGAVTVGTRVVEIGTRSDFFNYEHRMKRRRNRSIAVITPLILVLVGVLVYSLVFAPRDSATPGAETEPNDMVSQAETLTPGVQYQGFIAGGGEAGDVDWFRLRGPETGRWAVGASVSGVPGLDTALVLVDPSMTTAPLAQVNNAPRGGPETLSPTVVTKRDVFLVIKEARTQGIPAGSFEKTPYQVVYHIYDASGIEVEPNDAVGSATAMVLGSPLSGTLGQGDAVDWFSLAASVKVSTVQVSSVQGVDIVLTLKLGPEGREVAVDNLGPGAGEGVRVPAGPGPTRIAVRLKPAASHVSLAPYQILVK
jgi:serine/threonine-protein kinase